MTDQQKAIAALIEKIEAGEASTMGFELAGLSDWAEIAYHGSLDAALSLHEALVPGWVWGRCEKGNMWVMRGRADMYYHKSDMPARSLLISILRAYASQLTTASNRKGAAE